VIWDENEIRQTWQVPYHLKADGVLCETDWSSNWPAFCSTEFGKLATKVLLMSSELMMLMKRGGGCGNKSAFSVDRI